MAFLSQFSDTLQHKKTSLEFNIRPFLKWAGNKYSCLHLIMHHFPNAKRLIEPFTGSGAVFNNTDYAAYLLAEENRDLVALFTHLKNKQEPFIAHCKLLFCSENNTSERYYELREQFNGCTDSRQRAALFLYLNRHGYNGLCRYNKQGVYNVPFGRFIKPYFPEKEMRYFSHKSQQATFIHSDFRQTFTHAKKGDLIYCDPPYAPLDQGSNFTAYTRRTFGEQEQITLAELARASAARGITVLISNHDTEFTREQYRDADIISFTVNRKISCHAGHRVPAKELLAVFRG